MTTISLNGPAQQAHTNKCAPSASAWACNAPFSLYCLAHGHDMSIRCKRWRVCQGCARWMRWRIISRFVAGIEHADPDRPAKFFTLTFPAAQDPTEAEAHAALRGLVARLRRRDLLGYYGWVLQRTKAGTLHYHGIAEMPWMDDGLALWRGLVTAAGFGVQQQLLRALPAHSGYCARYISTGLADMEPFHRAYSFSQGFPPVPAYTDPNDLAAAAMGLERDPCEWVPGYLLRL